MRRNKLFIDEIVQFISDNYIGIGNQELTDLINDTFGTKFTRNQVKAYKHRNKLDSGLTGRFMKGQKAYNKGLKQEEFLSPEGIERSKKTRFKKGNRPSKQVPVGTERECSGIGYVKVKVGEPDEWRLKHRLVWEEHHGEIPEDKIVAFLDRDIKNTDISNLTLVSRATSGIINRYVKLSDDADLNKVIYHTVELEREVLKRAK